MCPEDLIARGGRAVIRPILHHRQDAPPLHQRPAMIERMPTDLGAVVLIYRSLSSDRLLRSR